GRERLVAHAVPGHGGADEVDLLALPVEHAARDGTDLVGCLELLDGGAHPLLVRACVVVQQGDVLATGGGHSPVASAGEAVIRLRDDQVYVGCGGPDALGAVVARSVLHDDNLKPLLRPVEFTKMPDSFDGVAGTTEVDEDNGDDT